MTKAAKELGMQILTDAKERSSSMDFGIFPHLIPDIPRNHQPLMTGILI